MWLQTTLGGNDRQITALPFNLQLAEHLQLPPGDLTGGVEGFIGRPFAGGVELGAAPTHQFQQRRPATGLLQGRHHHQQRPVLMTRQCTGHQGPGTTAASAQ